MTSRCSSTQHRICQQEEILKVLLDQLQIKDQS